MYKIPATTVFLGKNLVFMPECHSTNASALHLCQQSPAAAEGTVVITADQTAGRGQRGNVWTAEPGKNFTFSIILKPTFLAIQHQFYLNVFVSLAIRDYLCAKGCDGVRIKWPNDIYIHDKKVCGILIENQISGAQLSNSILGIGLNMNQQQFDIVTATSVSLALNHELMLTDELEELLQYIEERFMQLRHQQLVMLWKEYLAAMYWLNEMHTFSTDGKEFMGTITGVDDSGRLRVVTKKEEKVFAVREITYLF